MISELERMYKFERTLLDELDVLDGLVAMGEFDRSQFFEQRRLLIKKLEGVQERIHDAIVRLDCGHGRVFCHFDREAQFRINAAIEHQNYFEDYL